MELRHLLWSATTCDYPGAGLYFGLGLHSEHVALARAFSPRQLRVLLGGRVRVRLSEPPVAINYFAVRDPSTVKVTPVHQPPLHNGFRHVKLACNFDRAQANPESELVARQVDDLGRRIAGNKAPSTAAFLLTIGLGLAREDKFFHDALMIHPDQGWDDLYQRMKDLGCRGETVEGEAKG